jgi:hypothetical protein
VSDRAVLGVVEVGEDLIDPDSRLARYRRRQF